MHKKKGRLHNPPDVFFPKGCTLHHLRLADQNTKAWSGEEKKQKAGRKALLDDPPTACPAEL
jgi:hypothetical protein